MSNLHSTDVSSETAETVHHVRNLKHAYERKIHKFRRYETRRDIEMSHTLQDELYRQFIQDIDNGTMSTVEEMRSIASLLVQNVIPYDTERNRWYA